MKFFFKIGNFISFLNIDILKFKVSICIYYFFCVLYWRFYWVDLEENIMIFFEFVLVSMYNWVIEFEDLLIN